MGTTHARDRSWRYRNTLTWNEGRIGTLASEGKPDVDVATPSDFGGPGGAWTPEDLLVAAMNSCIMTTFLHFASRADVELVSYESDAEGHLAYDEGGLHFTHITVMAKVRVLTETHRRGAQEAFERCERACVISDALSCDVSVESAVEVVEPRPLEGGKG